MIRRFLCWMGCHEWNDTVFITEYGARCGDRCLHCKIWSKDSIITGNEEQEKQRQWD